MILIYNCLLQHLRLLLVMYRWLVETIIQHYDSIQQRVLEDVAKQTAEEEKGKEARKERIQKLKALQNTLEDLKPEYDTFNSGNPFRPLKEIAVTVILYLIKYCFVWLFKYIFLRRNGISPEPF